MTKYTIYQTAKFKRDLRLMQRQAKDLTKLKRALKHLRKGASLPSNYRSHILIGSGYQEIHLGYDWLLIYERSGHKIYLLRTGSHATLF